MALLAAITATGLSRATHADDPATTTQRRILGRATENAVPPRSCVLPNCGTVLAVHHRAPWEPSTPVAAHGISRTPGVGPFNPNLPVITQPSSSVQQRKEVWIVEVRRRDGTVQEFRQSYPALFQVGEEVLIQGDRIRVPD